MVPKKAEKQEVLSLRGRDIPRRPVSSKCRKCRERAKKMRDLTTENTNLKVETNELLTQLQEQFSFEKNLRDDLEEQENSNQTVMNMLLEAAAAAANPTQNPSEAGTPSPTDGVLIPNCTICSESWDSSGPHRMAALRCGHLIGFSCILECVERGMPNCPICREAVHFKDIRLIHN